jgi:hypothetical protein
MSFFLNAGKHWDPEPDFMAGALLALPFFDQSAQRKNWREDSVFNK